ncbi:hypothetical protein ACIQXV_01805 [Neobacillus sp. NPDC097160]|uniref:hypothetical protein n=1 Tax=Neobacillus sp. NPDC097160 TaxID=3364298 RepID=UPI0037F3F3BB
MSLKSVRMIQRLVGVLLLGYGIYLIFVTQEFFGTLLIIVAFIIFPSLNNKEKQRSHSNDYDYHDRYNDSANDYDNSTRGGDSDGGGGD